MNPNTNLDDRLQALGEALRSRPRLTDRVMNEVRRAVAEGSTEEQSMLAVPSMLEPRNAPRGRRRFFAVAAGAVATISAVLLVTMNMHPSPQVGWADVTQAIHGQKWIHGTDTVAGSEVAAMWLSPEQEIWAFKLPGTSYFYDGPERVKYEFSAGSQTITKLPLGEDDAQRVLSMNALSQDKSAVGHWLFGTEKVVSQKRMEVTEGGKTWIEFQLMLWRGDTNQATLRVDPETRLPVYVSFASPKDAKESGRFVFDYPAEGPSDIYALGVPRESKIDDRMPSNEVLTVLRAIAKSRAGIGNFRLIVARSPAGFSSVVYRKGDRWRVENWRPRVAVEAMPEESNEQEWDKMFDEQLQSGERKPLWICDGKSVWENFRVLPGDEAEWKLSLHVAPQDLLSGEGLGTLPKAPGAKLASLVFPDLSPKRGWGFEVDFHPADAPGCILLKRSAHVTMPAGTIGHEWYYVDPTKGYAVVRAELFNLPSSTPAKPEASEAHQTIRMESFRKSPQGFWYPAIVLQTMPVFAGDDPHGAGDKLQGRVVHKSETVTRYSFDFDVEMPDALFTVGDVPTTDR